MKSDKVMAAVARADFKFYLKHIHNYSDEIQVWHLCSS